MVAASVKKSFARIVILLVILMLFLFSPGQHTIASAQNAPISPTLLREGDLASALGAALGLANGRDESDAENRLSSAGIMPKNGWMADYPVTPDIAAELGQAVTGAADAGRLSLGRDEALRRLDTVLAGSNLPVAPYNGSAYADASSQAAPEYYPDQAALSSYYAEEGPPVFTYYTPPPDYSYLYWYVDYPFWCSGYSFPGFFILRDFHRFHHNRLVSNHFFSAGTNRVSRLNPTARLAGQAIGSAPVREFASPRAPAGAFGRGNSAGGTPAFRNPAAAPGQQHTFSAPRVSSQPRVAMAAPGGNGRPSGFGGGSRGFFASSPPSFIGSHASFSPSHSSGGFHSSGSFHASLSGGHSFSSGGSHGGGSHGGGGRGGGRR